MIPFVAVVAAALASAAAAAAAAGFRATHRARASQAPVAARWIEVGDAVVLDHGHGEALSIVRRVELATAGDAPFLVLLDAESHATRLVLAYDPVAADAVAILRPSTPSTLEALATLARGGARPPDAIEATIDGAPRALRLDRRCQARPSVATAEGASPSGSLPEVEAGASWLVALYGGASDAFALVLRDREGSVRAYVGRRRPAGSLDVLANRATPP